MPINELANIQQTYSSESRLGEIAPKVLSFGYRVTAVFILIDRSNKII